MSASVDLGAVALSLVAGRSRRLRRRMVALQSAALRRARRGEHRAASDRWKLMLRAHLVRQGLLRRWGLLP
jgi:hypothetical protein